MLKCQDITARASDWLDGELTLRQRVAVRMHLMMCRHCRRFVDGLAETVNLIHHHQPQRMATGLSEARLERIDSVLAPRLCAGAWPDSGTVHAFAEASNEPRMEGVNEPLDERVQRVFVDEATEGYVPNLFRIYAHHPDVLEHNWRREKALMHQGLLSEAVKSAIAVVVSHDNRCHYCVRHHTQALLEYGMDDAQIAALTADCHSAPFPEKERALLAITRQSNRNAHDVSHSMINWAREAGATDAEVVEAMAVMELYSSFNKFLKTLRIPLEQVSGS